MKNITRKALREMVAKGMATDITHWDGEKVGAMWVSVEALSHGTNGMNGGLFKDNKTGEYYVITARNGNLFRLA